MKKTVLILISAFALACSCSDKQENEYDGSGAVVLDTQNKVSSFSDENVAVLKITGDDITDLSGLRIRSVGTLVIRKTALTDISLPALESVTGDLTVEENSRLLSMTLLSSLNKVGGDLIVNNNPKLSSVAGLRDVKEISGDLVVTNNGSLGADRPLSEAGDWSYGLFPVLKLHNDGVVSGTVRLGNNNGAAAESVESIGKMAEPVVHKNYVIASASDAAAFSLEGQAVGDLTVKGLEITNDILNSLVTKGLRTVTGTFTLENTKVSSIERFCQSVTCEGSVILKDNTEGGQINTNGLRYYTRLGGDLVIDNSRVVFWTNNSSFATFIEIGGSVRVRNCGDLNKGDAFESLLRVGGDLEFSSCPNLTDLQGLKIEKIGGNLIVRDNDKLKALGGLEGVRSIGGAVMIKQNLPEYGDVGTPGWCMVKGWLENGVVADKEHSSLLAADGTEPDLSHVKACDGKNPQESNVPESYTITGLAELNEFLSYIPEKPETVYNFTVTGDDLGDSDLARLSERIGAVSGKASFVSLPGMTTTTGIFDKIEFTGGVILRDNQNLVDSDAMSSLKNLISDFIIENCPKLRTPASAGGTGWCNLAVVEGNFRIDGLKTVMKDGSAFPALQTVGGNFEIRNCSDDLESFSGMPLSVVGGDIVIMDNSGLKYLDGLENLMAVGGNVTIFNNPKIEVSPAGGRGYCMLRDFANWGVLSSTVVVKIGTDSDPVDFANVVSCNPGSESQPRSYVINGLTALKAFVSTVPAAGKETVGDLTIRGADITEEAFRSLDDRVAVVKGTFTMENLGKEGGNISTDQVLENIDLQGSIILRNIPAEINPNGFQNKTKVNGDLIIENCPVYPYWNWNPWKSLKEVTGDVRISGLPNFGASSFSAIERIGGSFIITDQPGFWHFRSSTLKYIGGDLTVRNCPAFGEGEALDGFNHLEHLGGNVLLWDISGWMPEETVLDGSTTRVGLCIFNWFKSHGIMNADATVKVRKDNKEVDMSAIPACKPE